MAQLRSSSTKTPVVAPRIFTGETQREIAFPIGGIGAGCISLGGWGQLRDWEVYNCPGKGNRNHFSFFTLNARPRGGTAVTKVLQGPVQEEYGRDGHGYYRESGSGFPHFRECVFSASYPFANLSLQDPMMPLRAHLCAWNPFIPLNDKDSSIPCAIFQWTITNPTRRTIDATLYMNINSKVIPEKPLEPCCTDHCEPRRINRFRRDRGIRGLFCTPVGLSPTSSEYGTLALATSCPDVTWLTHWNRTGWFNAATDWWAQATTGRLDESVVPSTTEKPGEPGSIGVRFSVRPGASYTLPFVISWLYPTTTTSQRGRNPTRLRVYAAAQWRDAWAVAQYVLTHLSRLERETRLYDETLRSTTLPAAVIESITTTSSILKTPTCVRLANGDFWAWEGCHNHAGCCEGSCTHVWNYQQMMPFLFPSLERNLRETDYGANLCADGSMRFRQILPLKSGTKPPPFGGAADGQLGGIMKVYREWRLSGDDAWLRALWPKVQRSLHYTWKRWDADRDGIMEGSQHNTYDINFWGANTMCGSLYLGALRAAEEMARHLGEETTANSYRELFERGRTWSDRYLFNGEYYEQQYNPHAYRVGLSKAKWRAALAHERNYCDNGRMRYQYGSGCLSDQLLGQLFAELLELGDLYDGHHIDSACDSIFKYNFISDFFDYPNPQRIFALDDEAGLLLCSWPRGQSERFPFPYSDEVWTGIEYTTAALLAYRGRIPQALRIFQAIRDRYNGARRNPFDEVECGHHYARAMASFAMLPALSGFIADLPRKRLCFAPQLNAKNFTSFFSVSTGWGLYRQRMEKRKSVHTLEIRYGKIVLQRLQLGQPKPRRATVTICKRTYPVRVTTVTRGVALELPRAVTLTPGTILRCVLEY